MFKPNQPTQKILIGLFISVWLSANVTPLAGAFLGMGKNKDNKEASPSVESVDTLESQNVQEDVSSDTEMRPSNTQEETTTDETTEPAPVEEAYEPTEAELAILNYNRGVEIFQQAQMQAETGNSKGQKRLLEQAVDAFKEAIKSDESLVNAESNIGFAYLTLKNYKKAIKTFEKTLEDHPHHLNTINGLATAYAFKGDTDKALKWCDELLTLEPGNPQYYYNKGSILQRSGKANEAEEAYRQALHLNPSEQRTLFNLGTLFENQGDLDGAKPFYEKAKDVDVSSPIGLESVRRIEAIEIALAQQSKQEVKLDD